MISFLLLVFLYVTIAVTRVAAAGLTYTLDNMENGLRIVQPQSTNTYKYIWGQNGGTGTTAIVTTEHQDGTHAIDSHHISTPDGDWQYHFYTYTEFLNGWSNGWNLISKFANNPTMNPSGGTPAWINNRINRLRFWIKFDNPSFAPRSNPASHNFEFGTFIRCPTCTGQESDNNHWYHFVSLGYMGGVWQQVIIDTHPDHQRGMNGDIEWPDQLHIYGPNYTYFDLMTRFYFDLPYGALPTGSHVYIDGVELYEETNNENIDQVRSLTAAYVPATNQLRVSWRGRKDQQETLKHDVRYSFSDIFVSGWAAAIPAPNGTVGPTCCGGDNGLEYSTTTINVSGHTNLYVAIKPQNSSLFRQIVVPLSETVVSSQPPAAPGALSVQ